MLTRSLVSLFALGGLALSLNACFSDPLDAVVEDSQKSSASITVRSDGNDVDVSARFFAKEGGDLPVRPSSQLEASLGGLPVSLHAETISSEVFHVGKTPARRESVPFVLKFTLDGDVHTTSETTLPAPFEVTGVPSVVHAADQITVHFSRPLQEGEEARIHPVGDCLFSIFDDDGKPQLTASPSDPTTFTGPLDSVSYLSNDWRTCDVDLHVRIRHRGTVDKSFRSDSKIDGIQYRVFKAKLAE